MSTFKRVVAVIVMVLSVVGIVLCLVEVLGAWAINTPVTNSVTKLLSGIENVLEVSEGALEQVNTRLDQAVQDCPRGAAGAQHHCNVAALAPIGCGT